MNKRTAADGMIKCLKNAQRLIESAQVLFEKDHEIGTVLLTTAIEEYSKVVLILGLCNGSIPEKRFFKMFRSHNTKRAVSGFIAIVGTLIADNAKDTVRFRRLISSINFHSVRDGALYVDYINGDFIEPESNFSNCAKILQLALRLKRVFGALKTKKACLELLNSNLNKPLNKKEKQREEMITKILNL